MNAIEGAICDSLRPALESVAPDQPLMCCATYHSPSPVHPQVFVTLLMQSAPNKAAHEIILVTICWVTVLYYCCSVRCHVAFVGVKEKKRICVCFTHFGDAGDYVTHEIGAVKPLMVVLGKHVNWA